MAAVLKSRDTARRVPGGTVARRTPGAVESNGAANTANTANTASAASTASTAAKTTAKARQAADCDRLEQLPNIGPALAADLRLIGIVHPRELAERDAFALYQALCAKTGRRQDPCVLDTFMAATDFMRGATPAPWWHYTPQRKAQYGQV